MQPFPTKGIHGGLAVGVDRRCHQIGVRLALGAGARAVRGAVLGGGLALTGAGVVFGGLGALALSRFLASLRFQVSATDPLVFGAAPLLVVATGLLASWLPARGAMAVDPAESPRGE